VPKRTQEVGENDAGQDIPGLVRRRSGEADLFTRGIYRLSDDGRDGPEVEV
jgi:hypothetical protein